MSIRTAPILALLGPAILAAATGTLAEEGALRGMPPSRLFPAAEFAPGVPTQQSVLGFLPGERPMRHDELLRYLQALAQASPRVKSIEYARSYEDRPLVVLAVSDEATIARLEPFRLEHAKRMDPRGRPLEADARGLDGAKAVAWLAYGIHGDETSSTDAAAALAYWLVAGEDDRARKLRDGLVILIDPCENPDGRERFLAQTTAFAHAHPNPDSEDLSHATVWPWGRGNHYLFDLNRDWFTLVNPESRRSEVIASWNPQLMVDSHEMGADDTYLFSPPRHPFNPFLPPSARVWWDRFAVDQARALDARGYGYYSREWNEEFFPGYGSSWASYLGAIGILYEMSSTEGTLVRQRPGTLRTFAEAVEHHVASSVSNLGTLLANRVSILQDYVAARRETIRRGGEGPVRAWILPPGRDPARTNELASVLRRQGIDVLRAASGVKAAGLRDARTGKTVSLDLPPGTWLIPLDQPMGRLARVLLDPHVPMEPAFLREERDYLERGKGSRLYDTTAWSLVLSYGVEAYWTPAKPGGDWRAEDAPASEGRAEQATNAFGWLLDGTTDRGAFALADLLERGIAVRVAEKPFRAAGRSFGRGAVLVKREGNPEDLAATLADVARRFTIEITPTPTAKAEEGPDLGGHYYHPLVAPRVGIWSGQPISPSGYGVLWHLLDRQAGIRFSGLDLSRFDQTDLSRYNVLVFPPSWGGYRQILGERGLERLRRWIEAGGTAIGIGGGSEYLADKDSKLTKTRLRRQALDKYPPVVWGAGAAEAEAAGSLRAAGIRAPEPPGATESKEKGEKTAGEAARAAKKTDAGAQVAPVSSLDVPPVIGAGAQPFAISPGEPRAVIPQNLASWLKPVLPPGKDRPDAEDLERADERLRRFAPRGAFVRADLDPDVFLAWGLPEQLDVWLDSNDTLVAEPPVQVAARFADLESLHLGGLLWPEAAGRLAKTAYCTREEIGRGQVILFVDEPNYRGWLLGTRRLLLNAILYGPGVGTRWSSPW